MNTFSAYQKELHQSKFSLLKKIEYILICFTIIFCSWQIEAAPANKIGLITGQVTDAVTGLPLPGVDIKVQARIIDRLPDDTFSLRDLDETIPLGFLISPDDQGQFMVKVPLTSHPNFFKIILQKEGYQELFDAIVEVEANETTKVDFQLIPLNLTPEDLEVLNRNHEQEKQKLYRENPSYVQELTEWVDIPGTIRKKSLKGTSLQGTYSVPDQVYVRDLEGFGTGWINFDEFISGVVSAEMGDSFPMEALKAQAIAARSYALERYERTDRANGGQAYKSQIGTKSREATVDTTKIVILYSESVISAYYSARCNGDFTLNYEDGVWHRCGNCTVGCKSAGECNPSFCNNVPYVRSRPCSGHLNCSSYPGEKPCCHVFTGGRWVHIYGHGVGMCQRGAQDFANSGKDWRWIIRNYYTDIELANDSQEVAIRIDNHSAYPKQVEVGKDTELSFWFTNTGNIQWTFGAAATLRKPTGDEVDLPIKPVTLKPGQQGSAQWIYTIDMEGSWDLVFGVWKESSTPVENSLGHTDWLRGYITGIVTPNQPPIAEAAVSTNPNGPYYGYENPLSVTKGKNITLYFFADKDVNGDGKASYDPDGWTDSANGVSSGGRCEWNTDLNQGTPTFEKVIPNPSSPTACNVSPYSYTFNDPLGTYEYQILRITDRKGAQSNVSKIRITVTDGSTPVEIITTSLSDGTVGEYYSRTLQATGGTPSYTWTLHSGTLPTGLSLSTSNNNGIISGTPTTANTYSFTIKVTDSESQTDTQTFTITIIDTGTQCHFADLDKDGDVDIVDVRRVGMRWNTRVGDALYDSNYDFNSDGRIDIIDVRKVAQYWGQQKPCTPASPNIAQFNSSPKATPIYLQAKQSKVKLGERFTVELLTKDLQRLRAFEFHLRYDNNKLEVHNIVLGEGFTNSAVPVIILGPKIDNREGSIIAGTVFLGQKPISEPSEVFASLEFVAQKAGMSTLELEELKLIDSNERLLPVEIPKPTLINILPQAPMRSVLLQNYPNPFNPDTWIPYQLAFASDVKIQIYDVSGRLVRTLNLGYKDAGYYQDKASAAYWDGRNEFGEGIASGVYFYTLKAGKFIATRRMLIAK